MWLLFTFPFVYGTFKALEGLKCPSELRELFSPFHLLYQALPGNGNSFRAFIAIILYFITNSIRFLAFEW